MKRTPKITRYNARLILPFFSWYLCETCKREFRRELGWVWPGEPGHFVDTYLCMACHSDRASADAQFKIIENERVEERRRNRPLPPLSTSEIHIVSPPESPPDRLIIAGKPVRREYPPGPPNRLRKEGEQVSREKRSD